MRIVSYNVRYFGHGLRGLASTAAAKQRIAKALSSLDPLPDVVCLQEVEHRSIRSLVAHRGGQSGESQLDAFMRHLSAAFQETRRASPYRAIYFPAHVYGVGAFKVYTTGLAMLLHTDQVQLVNCNESAPHSVTHYNSSRFRAAKQTRICAHAELEGKKGENFHVFNTHLSLPTPFDRSFWREERRMGHGPNQLQEARALSSFISMSAGKEPFVLCGDFNSAPGSPVYRFLRDEMSLSVAQEQLKQIKGDDPDQFPTAGFMQMRMHLDHLFGSGVNWVDLQETHTFGCPNSRFDGLSDHMPLIARFSVG